jgi:filamentous hemagglutinin family protein
VPAGREAFFKNAVPIQNILTRVTGNSVSNIDGLIRARGTANLFLLNPNGIVFGPNATLNIRGSLVASTAKSLVFADRTVFSATPATKTTPLLSVSVPLGLQYGSNPGSLGVQGSRLRVKPGQTLALVGGNVSLESGRLLAPGGRVELGGVAGESTVGLLANGSGLRLSFPDSVPRKDVSITNGAVVNVRAGGGGSIAINARSLNMTGGDTALRAGIALGRGSVDSVAGDIEINATETIKLNDSVIANFVQARGVGNGGNVNITTGSLFVTNGARLSASTGGRGNAGSVNIFARDRVSFVDAKSEAMSSVVSKSAVGDGGNINITTGELSVTNGAQLNAVTRGQGNAGNVNIAASDTVSFEAGGAFTRVEQTGSADGGNINITTGELRVTNGAALSASILGEGKAGNVTIVASDTVSFDGVGSDQISSGAFTTVAGIGSGDGGNINISTHSLKVTNGAQLSARNIGQGNAGNLYVTANSVLLDNKGQLLTGTASGEGGNIKLQVENLLLMRHNSRISAQAFNNGNGGNIDMNARLIVAVPKENSDIVADAQQGEGGNINITTSGIFGLKFRDQRTNESDITASSDIGLDGEVTINQLDVDPSQGLAALPTNFVDASSQIDQSCSVAGSQQESRFVITGTGGLPPRPGDPIALSFPTVPVRSLPNTNASNEAAVGSVSVTNPSHPGPLREAVPTDQLRQEKETEILSATASSHPPTTPTAAPLVEASGWVYGSKGEVMLVAQAPTSTPGGSWSKPPTCQR